MMVKYKKLEQTIDYQRTITELSKDLYFEYEIAKDTLSFTELFREVFGKDSTITGFRNRLEKTKVIHSEEQPAVVGIYNSMMSGRKQARFELRLIPKDGNPCWYICYASIIFDENRNPYKVVGKLSTINQVAKDTEVKASDYKPQMDTLTNVFTKESAEFLIKEAVAKQETESSLCAFLLVDIRNYKNINEVRRSIQSENILTTVGEILNSQCRTFDIIGRIGLSEFVIYLRDIHSDKTAYDMAERICKKVGALYSYEHTKNGITASIGIAFQQGEQEYQTMFTNANAALVMAKKVPGSSFEVFSGTINN
jgi:diguanylate cyclase (GGDEF)-like protein